MADTTILSWITAEVDQALETVRRSIASFLGAQEDASLLNACPEHLHQVSGALRMVGLTGATRFCEAIERSFAARGDAVPTAGSIEVLDRSVLALKEFVNDLARGQANVPLRLFTAYRDLARLNGVEDGCEKDLFFPDLASAAPPHRAPRTLPASELGSFMQAQRVGFQRGLLGWLRGRREGVEEMRRAVEAVHQIAAQLPEPHGLWWASLALFDGLTQPDDGEWLKCAKALCNKIDFHIRDLATGAGGDGEPLMREVLFLVAKAPVPTERMTAARQLYRLDSLFPAAAASGGGTAVDVQFLEVALYDLHSRLEALKSAWVRYVSGEKHSAGRFRDLLASFRAKAGEVGSSHLTKLLDAVALVATRLPDPYPTQQQFMVIEMAAAFLLMEQVVDRFTSPPEDLDRQIVLMGGWLLDAEKGKSTGEPPSGLRPELTQQIGALQLRAQVAKEILRNLQHVEQVLDAFARDSSRRNALPELDTPLRQIHGALSVLGFERGAQVLKLCERMIAACTEPNHALTARDMDWIAEGLSSLGFFLAPCVHGREPAEQALAVFFARFDKARACAETTPGDITVTLQPVVAQGPSEGADPQLLGIFLDEAKQVLESIGGAATLCKGQLDNRDALATIRRGFHTLKGSGRMVGLDHLGEAAWEMEQTLNAWLEQKRPATPSLLELIDSATSLLGAWAAQRRNGVEQDFDLAEIIELARRNRLAPETAEDTASVTIDDVTLPSAFFEIYAKEAAEHTATLEREFETWSAAPKAGASQEFMRAAHTLASSSRTAGFVAIADLASAVEQWMAVSSLTPSDDTGVLHGTVLALSAMVQDLAHRKGVRPAHSELAALRDLTARLRQPSVAEKRVMRDDMDPQLLPVFLEEAQELVPVIGADLRDWKADPGDTQASQSLQRALHTLKGSARMAGAIRLGELTHLLESQIDTAMEAGEYPPTLFEELESKVDRLSMDVERLRAGAGPAKAQAHAPMELPAALLRVNADTLDHLINESGEVAIARSRMETELRAVKQSLSELGESVTRLRSQLREVEVQADSQMQSRLSVLEEKSRDYDPLEFDRYTRLQELTRLMAESLNDVVAIQQTLMRNAGETEAALLQQARISRGLQHELMRMRAVPFSNLNERLYRVVRQVARELQKKAELDIVGAEVELDRSVLERIAAPLEHILRNAVVHGLETSVARSAAGKPESGRIHLTLRQESNEIALIIADDGAGLDLRRLREKAEAMGLLGPNDTPSDAELMQLVFASGVSTADEVTEIAGRGVGMDVVRNEIANLGGRVHIESHAGRGTAFTLYLPLTLAVTQAVLVRCASSVLAIASGMVEQVLRLKGDALAELHGKGVIEAQGRSHPLHSLRELLGNGAAIAVQDFHTVLLIRSGMQHIAVHVDELVGNREIVVKPVGPQLSRIAGITGATVLPDGAIALILNPVLLAQAAHGATRSAPDAKVAEPTPAAAAPLVMVVDDSLTVRKVTGRLLEREGYRVATARDGLEAIETLKDLIPAALLVDIEMPRMDGFELSRHVRNDPRLAGVPIIIISSRTAGKHRAQAVRLGVNAFLGKPYQESELLQQLAECVAA